MPNKWTPISAPTTPGQNGAPGRPGANGGGSWYPHPTDAGRLIQRKQKYLGAGIRAALDANTCAVISAISDSTFQDTTPARSALYELADLFAAEDAGRTVQVHRIIGTAGANQVDMPNRIFTRPATVIQTGTAGPRRYNFSGTSTAEVKLNVSSVPLPTSRDLDVRVYGVRPNSWTVGTQGFTTWNSQTSAQNLVSVFRSSGDGLTEEHGWAFSLSGGYLHVTHWNSPTSSTPIKSSFLLPTTGVFATDTDVAVRFELDADDGAGNHIKRAYWSGDGGATWTQAGSTATVAGVATYTINAHPTIDVGAHSFGSFHRFAGRIGEVEIRDGIGGRIIAPTQLDNWMTGGGGFSVSGAPVLAIWSHSVSGASTSGHLSVKDIRRGPMGALLTIIAISHNEGDQGPSSKFWTNLKELADDAKTKNPVGIVAIASQNLRMAPAGSITQHLARCLSMSSFAENSYSYIGVTEGWLEAIANGTALDPLLRDDGIHTETLGSELTANIMWQYLGENP